MPLIFRATEPLSVRAVSGFFLDRSDDAVYIRPHSAFSLLQHATELAKLGVDYFVVDVTQGQLKKKCAKSRPCSAVGGNCLPLFPATMMASFHETG